MWSRDSHYLSGNIPISIFLLNFGVFLSPTSIWLLDSSWKCWLYFLACYDLVNRLKDESLSFLVIPLYLFQKSFSSSAFLWNPFLNLRNFLPYFIWSYIYDAVQSELCPDTAMACCGSIYVGLLEMSDNHRIFPKSLCLLNGRLWIFSTITSYMSVTSCHRKPRLISIKIKKDPVAKFQSVRSLATLDTGCSCWGAKNVLHWVFLSSVRKLFWVW